MSREIKFRAISLCKGEHWLYGDIRHYAHNPHTEKWTIHDPATGTETDIDETTVGQFTGLYDENGKEIYEGDIIEATSILGGSIGRKMKCSVDYYNDFACFIFVASDRRRFICTSISDIVVEVIGNIYDNPELLKN